MAIKTKDEILESIKLRLGEDTSDDALSLIEDITDTFTNFESLTKDNADWKAKYESNDKEWREKYRNRFFDGGDSSTDDFEEPDEEEPSKTKFDDLFNVKEN